MTNTLAKMKINDETLNFTGIPAGDYYVSVAEAGVSIADFKAEDGEGQTFEVKVDEKGESKIGKELAELLKPFGKGDVLLHCKEVGEVKEHWFLPRQ